MSSENEQAARRRGNLPSSAISKNEVVGPVDVKEDQQEGKEKTGLSEKGESSRNCQVGTRAMEVCCLIQKTPAHIKSIKPGIFEPKFLAIGPYQQNRGIIGSIVGSMATDVMSFLDDIFTRGRFETEMAIHSLTARKYYSDLESQDEDLIDQKMLYGAMYLLFYIFCRSPAFDIVDYKRTTHWCDIIKLENQIPFSIVKKICENWEELDPKDNPTFAKHNPKVAAEDLKDLYAALIEDLLETKTIPYLMDRPDSFEHLLHVLHHYFRPSTSNTTEVDVGEDRGSPSKLLLEVGEVVPLCGASILSQSGVHFKKKRGYFSIDDHAGHACERKISGPVGFSLLDITFKDGELEIPHLQLDEEVACLLGSLVAFEMTYPYEPNCVTEYVIFMSELMNSPEDVRFLHKERLVINDLGSYEEVSAFFKELVKKARLRFKKDSYLWQVRKSLEEHYQDSLEGPPRKAIEEQNKIVKLWGRLCEYILRGNFTDHMNLLVAIVALVVDFLPMQSDTTDQFAS